MSQKKTKLKIIYSQRYICTLMFIAALFTVAKAGKKTVSFYRGLGKKDVIHFYSGILLIHKKR